MRRISKAELRQEKRLSTLGVCFLDMGGGDAPPAPNYQPMAAASDHAADLSYKLGTRQLDMAQQQYNEGKVLAKPVIDSQVKLTQQAYDQGQANYDRMVKEGQPVQDQMKSIAMGGDYSAAQKAKQEEAAGQAIADARNGSTQQMNQLVRQGLRYGYSPARLAALSGTAAVAGAQGQVAAANGARMQKQTQQWGQMGDTYNTFAGLGSQAPAFYGAGTQAGNSAIGNNNSINAGLMSGMSAANGTTMQGQGMRIQGLGNVLNSQTSAYGAGLQNASANAAGLGQAAGSAAALYMLS